MTKATNARYPRFLVVSSKGGAGKSTIAQQVCATWLLTRLNADSATLIELDDQNQDSLWLTKSAIRTKRYTVDNDANSAILDMFGDYAGQPFVLDLGNQTAPDAISSMSSMNRLSTFDAIFVPVKDVGQDLINAQRTIKTLLEEDPKCKIVIVLNGIMRPSQDPKDKKTMTYYGDIIDYAETEKFPLMIMPGVEGYGMSRKLGKTFVEIASIATQMTEQLNSTAIQADAVGDGETMRNMMRMVQIVNTATNASVFIGNLHNQIDEIIGWDK